jgi:multiple antibiotic resistance protein
MEFKSIDLELVLDVFLLLFIGIGPKIALVPFLELTAGMDEATRRRVSHKMIVTAGVVAVILVGLGEFLTKLLHFSTGALSVASGIVLFIIAATMILGSGDPEAGHGKTQEQDPMRLAVYPLAVPYLLNPAGIVVLVTASADGGTVATFAVLIGVLAVVIGIDALVFRWADRVGEHLDEGRLLITEKVFGFLLAALAVQLALDGLDAVGAIHLTGH